MQNETLLNDEASPTRETYCHECDRRMAETSECLDCRRCRICCRCGAGEG